MILLDTNVVSELLRPKPDANVTRWLGAQDLATLYLSSTVAAELFIGVERLPAGRRRTAIAQAVESILLRSFAGRILPLDGTSSAILARTLVAAERAGITMSFQDAAIAAVALQHDLVLATRNVKDFSACAVKLLNPWTA